MKTGFLQLLLAALVLPSGLALAQTGYEAAVFDSGEVLAEGVDARLQSAQFLSGDIALPDTSTSYPTHPAHAAQPRPVSDSFDATTSSMETMDSVDTTMDVSDASDRFDAPTTPTTAPDAEQSMSGVVGPDAVATSLENEISDPVYAPEPAPISAPTAPTYAQENFSNTGNTYAYDSGHSSSGNDFAAAPAASQPTLDSQEHWQIRNGERLSDVFTRWSAHIGWQLTWEPEDLIALANLELDDNFTGAITKVIDALNRNGANVQAQFYTANRMLRIMARK